MGLVSGMLLDAQKLAVQFHGYGARTGAPAASGSQGPDHWSSGFFSGFFQRCFDGPEDDF